MKLIVCKACGNSIQAVDGDGKPACPICIGTHEDSGIPVEIEVDTSDFKCSMCGKLFKDCHSYKEPPFANVAYKIYYCGCRGWD